MKTAFTLLAGVAIGALAIQGLHAQQTGGQQQMPKVIYVSEIDVSNPEGYGKEFAPNLAIGLPSSIAVAGRGINHLSEPWACAH